MPLVGARTLADCQQSESPGGAEQWSALGAIDKQLRADGLNFQSFDAPVLRKRLGINVKGGFRALVARPLLINGKPTLTATLSPATAAAADTIKPGGADEGLQLRFALPKSCYATEMLRQLMEA